MFSMVETGGASVLTSCREMNLTEEILIKSSRIYSGHFSRSGDPLTTPKQHNRRHITRVTQGQTLGMLEGDHHRSKWRRRCFGVPMDYRCFLYY